MKKNIFIITILSIILLLMQRSLIVNAGQDTGCTIHDAVGHKSKEGVEDCGDVCKVIDDNKYSKAPEENVSDYYCSTCLSGRAWKNEKGEIVSNFFKMYAGCCAPSTMKSPCDFWATYCDYSKNNIFGKCNKTLITKSVTNSSGQCIDWYLPPTYSIRNLPMMENVGTNASKYSGNGEVFKIWEPFVISNSKSNTLKSLNQNSENYDRTLQAYLLSNGLQMCGSDADCVRCPDTNLDCLACKNGEKKPHYKCNASTLQCQLDLSCGQDECNYYTIINDEYYDVSCCKEVGEQSPHHECKMISEKNVTYYTCETIDACGKNQCDPAKNKEVYSNALKKKVMQSEECTPTTSSTSSTTTSTTSSTIPNDGSSNDTPPSTLSSGGSNSGSSGKYFCDPNSQKGNGYFQCVAMRNPNPLFSTCNPVNDHQSLVKIYSSDEGFCTYKAVTYNTDCPENQEIRPSDGGLNPKYCNIYDFAFINNNSKGKDLDTLWVNNRELIEKYPLKYNAFLCNMCKITINTENQIGDTKKFVIDNPVFLNSIDPITVNEDNFNEYAGQLILDIDSLSPNKYIITLTCTDLIGNTDNQSVVLRIPEYYRWRETVPIINQ